MLKRDKERYIIDGLLLKMPIFGPIVLKSQIALLTRSLAVLLQARTSNENDGFTELLAGQKTILQTLDSARLTTAKQKPTISTSSLLSPRLWELCLQRASSGWTRMFSSYMLLSEDALPLRMCQTGDLVGLQRLLCNRDVSLNDRSVDGASRVIGVRRTDKIRTEMSAPHVRASLLRYGPSYLDAYTHTTSQQRHPWSH